MLIFSHTDYTVGSGLTPDQLLAQVTDFLAFIDRQITVGRESANLTASPCPEELILFLRSLLYACFSDLSTINFHRECDALFFQVNIQYLYLNDIADTDHFQRMFDKTVTHL